jgi:hypothetical protein
MSDAILPVQRINPNIDVTPESAQFDKFESALSGVEPPLNTQPVLEIIDGVEPTTLEKVAKSLGELQDQQNKILLEGKALERKAQSSQAIEADNTIREYDGHASSKHIESTQEPQDVTVTTNQQSTGLVASLDDIKAQRDVSVKQIKHLLIVTTIFAPIKAGVDTLKQLLRM